MPTDGRAITPCSVCGSPTHTAAVGHADPMDTPGEQRISRVRVYLVNGEVVEGDQHDMTADEVARIKDALSEMLASSDGWQVSVERGESWFVFPKQSVLYVEIEVR